MRIKLKVIKFRKAAGNEIFSKFCNLKISLKNFPIYGIYNYVIISSVLLGMCVQVCIVIYVHTHVILFVVFS